MEAKEWAMLAFMHVEGSLLTRVLRDKDILIEMLLRALRQFYCVFRAKPSYAWPVCGQYIPHYLIGEESLVCLVWEAYSQLRNKLFLSLDAVYQLINWGYMLDYFHHWLHILVSIINFFHFGKILSTHLRILDCVKIATFVAHLIPLQEESGIRLKDLGRSGG